jgi:hypothetical protein
MATSFAIPQFGGADGGPSSTTLPAMPGGGQNQYMNYPGMGGPGFGGPQPPIYSGAPGMSTTQASPYGVPPLPSLPAPFQNAPNMPGGPWPTAPAKSAGTGLQGGAATVPSTDPYFTQLWQSILTGQAGQGVSPFNLSTYLPSSGQMTQPGQLSPPLTSTMQSLQDFYMGQSQGVSGVPGTSDPLSYVLPMWQSEVSAMNQPIQQQLANIKEQFGQQGALGSSEMAQALANYGSQTALQEQNLLGQLTMQALPQQQAFGQQLQGLDQQAIQNMYQEFIRTQPQYNPLLSMENQLALSYPPIYGKQGFAASFGGALGGSLGQGIGQGVSGLVFG